MKIKVAINVNFGGFGLGELDFIKQFRDDNLETRSDPRLIEFIEKNIDNIQNIVIVEMPAEATDYWIDEYDGCETLCYVLNGEIYEVDEPEEDDEDDA